MRTNRRRALGWCAGALVSAMATTPALGIGPMVRPARGRWKVGLAGYSLRKFFQRPADAADRLDLRGFLNYCAQHDADGAELTQYYFPDPVTEAELLELKRHAHLVGVEVCGGAIRNNFTVSPGAELDAQLQHIETWCRHYAWLGAPVMRVFAGQPPAGLETEAVTERIAEGLTRACEVAGRYGIILALENHDWTTDVDRLLAIVQRVESPWLGVNFDSGNFGSTSDPYEGMERLAPFAVSAQLKVSIDTRDGKRPADWERILNILDAARYAGYVTLEYEEADDPYEVIPGHLRRLRELVANRGHQ